MSATQDPYATTLRDLASLIVAVAGESVTMVKRSVPDRALKLKKQAEWEIYLEFLRALFNLADRLSAHYVPLKEQPIFMDGLEDAVTQQLKNALAPALGPDVDDMEVTVTIGRTVAESRERYERFKFLATEESKQKEEFFKYLGQSIAARLDVPDHGVVVSTATLCTSAAIPAMRALFESVAPGPASSQTAATPGAEAGAPSTRGSAIGNEIKLISVMSTIQGEEIETRWGMHPRFRQDLKPEQAQEMTRLMNRIAQILGARYATVAFSPEWAAWQQKTGHA